VTIDKSISTPAYAIYWWCSDVANNINSK